MADPVAFQILEALRERLYVIKTADGYNTNLAQQVELVRRPVTPNDIAMCGIVQLFQESEEEDEELSSICGAEGNIMNVSVEAYMLHSNQDQTRWLSLITQDLKRALFLSTDRQLGGLAASVDRGAALHVYPEPGGETIAVRQSVIVRYIETYGTP